MDGARPPRSQAHLLRETGELAPSGININACTSGVGLPDHDGSLVRQCAEALFTCSQCLFCMLAAGNIAHITLDQLMAICLVLVAHKLYILTLPVFAVQQQGLV